MAWSTCKTLAYILLLPGKVIVDDPRLPAFPESAEEAHARINVVLEVSSSKQGRCRPMLITLCPVAAVAIAVRCAGHWQSIPGKHFGRSAWRGVNCLTPATVMQAAQLCYLIQFAPYAGHQ